MSLRAWIFVAGVLVAGTLLAGATLFDASIGAADAGLFLLLFILATVAQVSKVEAPNHTLYYATTVFTFAGLLLLPPACYVALVAGSHLMEWSKERLMKSSHLHLWYLQPFNVANNTINGIAALLIYRALNPAGLLYEDSSAVIAALSAACVSLVANRVILGMALILGRGLTWRTSNVFDVPNFMAELVLLFLGYSVALAWRLNPLLLVPTLAPLLIVYQALRVPLLQHEASRDAKTGLLNARHFQQRYDEEFARAQRFSRPLSVIMADLDYLRTVNNSYGHVAGDNAIAGIGKIIGASARDYDIAARFGGEEFVIVLPETDQSSAMAVAERIRQVVATTGFAAPSRSEPFYVTVSLGIATFPADGISKDGLLHNADVALYQAKLLSRNRTVCFSAIPRSADHVAEIAAIADEASGGPPSDTAGAGDKPPAVTAAARADTQGRPPAEAPQADNPGHQVGAASPWLWPFVTFVIAAGIAISIGGLLLPPSPNLPLIIGLMAAAAIAELFHIDLYGQGTISVTVALLFAAAAVAGLPGLSLASAACAVSAALVLRHSTKRTPQMYKVLFNWANHVVAGCIPAVGYRLLRLPIRIATLPLLILPTMLFGILYFLIETGFVARAISLSSGQPFRQEWSDRYRWLMSSYVILAGFGVLLVAAGAELGAIGVAAMLLPVVFMRHIQQQYVGRTATSMRELERLNRELSRANDEIRQVSREIGQLNDELFETLARFFDARDPYVGEHAITVARYTVALGRELGLAPLDLKQLRQAALLHDIGKIAIPESILHKPGTLTDNEYALIQSHVEVGASLIMQSQGLRHLVPFVRHHHERWDGRGYPDGLVGEAIPIEARIIGLCDAVEAMASDRPYRKGLSPDEIVAEIQGCAGTQFDPALSELFVRLVGRPSGMVIINSARNVVRRQPSPDLGYQPSTARW